jgi:DNA ligase-1
MPLAEGLPSGTVLDGELLPWKAGRVQPFADLQKRIGRKSVTPKLLAEIPTLLSDLHR